SGVSVAGPIISIPAAPPDLAIEHYSYDNLNHYLTKLNGYTDGEALAMHADRASHSWRAQIAHFVHDWQVYYERGRGDLDGMHGFVLHSCQPSTVWFHEPSSGTRGAQRAS